ATVTLAKELAADVGAVLELSAPTPQAVLIVDELFQETATVEALYDQAPDAALLSRLTGHSVTVASLPDQDWIKLSQEGLAPVRAGRFFVYGAHDQGRVPSGVIAMRIEAGLAFGTGHHETTALCLGVLSALARRRSFANVLDLGSGTGLLAIAHSRHHCRWSHPSRDPRARTVRLDRREHPGEPAHPARASHRACAGRGRHVGLVGLAQKSGESCCQFLHAAWPEVARTPSRAKAGHDILQLDEGEAAAEPLATHGIDPFQTYDNETDTVPCAPQLAA